MAERRTETVTLLFTDVEGSTRLLKQLRDRYADLLAEHELLLREIFTARDGVEVDTQGDSFFVAFPRPRAAVLAAVEAQRAIAAHEWPDGAVLRVRIGMHTGETSVASGRYVGVAVHRAARICAAGHGGQVLVSETTKSLLEDEEAEPEGVGFVDLGERRLKDLDRPIRLYQLSADGLQSEFPPVRTAEHTPERGVTPFAPEPAPARGLRDFWPPPRMATIAGIVAVLVIASVVAVITAARGGDGTPALVAVKANSVGIIDPARNAVTGQVAVGAGPDDIAVSGDRAWIVNRGDGTISVVDAESLVIERVIPVARDAGVAFGSGAVQVATSPGRSSIRLSRLDPFDSRLEQTASVRLKTRSATLTGLDVTPVVTGLGSTWVASGETLLRFAPGGGRIIGTLRVEFSILDLAVGEGAVWVGGGAPDTVSVGYVAKVDAAAGGVVARAELSGVPSVGVGEGSVWVAAGDRVYAIEPTAGTIRESVKVGEYLTDVAVGEGSVWVTDRLSRTVWRIDPERMEVTERIPVGGYPESVAVSDGRVWVTVQ